MFRKLAFLPVAAFLVLVTLLQSIPAFAVDNYISAYIHDNGNTYMLSSYADTVGDLLSEAGIYIGSYDTVSPELSHTFGNFAEHHITITRGFRVTVMTASSSEEVEVPSGMKVGFLIQRLREERGLDYIYDGSLNEDLVPGQLVKLSVATTEHTVEYELISFDTQQIMSEDIPDGQVVIINEGREGIREIIYSVVSINGVVQSRQLISNSVTILPETRVIHVGIGQPIVPTPAVEQPQVVEEIPQVVEEIPQVVEEIPQVVEEIPVVEQPHTEVIELFETFEQPDTQIENLGYSEPLNVVEEVVEEFDPDAPPKQYRQILRMGATAYTADYASTGKNPGHPLFGVTASGMMVRYGVVAVDPNVIPLGTNLYIYGYGYCIAADTGSAIKGNRIDLYFNTAEECYRFGYREIEVYILD